MTYERVHGQGPMDLPTERRHPGTTDLDLMPTLDLLRLINAEDATVAEAVRRALPDLALAVDLGVARLRAGGSIHYFGAGTSGRLATLDAAELAPTFGLEPGRVVAHHAGGLEALETALEDVEDDHGSGRADAAGLTPDDLALGLTASGRTPYVAGALEAAREAGVSTVLVSANPEAGIAPLADVHICLDTGAEVLAGSTRMKAGTAQKLALNAFSTAVMVRLGRTYSNLMTGVVAKNAKLRGRMVGILSQASGDGLVTCERVLTESDGDLNLALVRLLAGVDHAAARAALDDANGVVRSALVILHGATSSPATT